MKNLLEVLCAEGLSETEAKNAIEIVFEWVEERYPVLAVLAENTVMKELAVHLENKQQA